MDRYVEIVRRCCAFAAATGREITESKEFRFLSPRNLNIVLFQPVGYEDVEMNEKVKDTINRTGEAYISATKWKK